MSQIDSNMTSDVLITMYRKQYELQCFMHDRRGLKMPPAAESDYIEHEHVLAAIYFSSCVNIEWMELQEAYWLYLDSLEMNLDEKDVNIYRTKALEELIDVLHFILSVFIFLGLKEESMERLSHLRLGGITSLAEYAGSTAVAISAVLASAPYKTWKDQDNTKKITSDYNDLLFSKFMVCFNNVLDFAFYCLDSSYEEVSKVYMVKNALNFRRQDDKSLGYIQS